jgi:hypothetical protein
MGMDTATGKFEIRQRTLNSDLNFYYSGNEHEWHKTFYVNAVL